MKVIVVNGHVDTYLRHNYANQIADYLDSAYDNPVIKKVWANHDECNAVDEKQMLQELADAYKDNDYDFYIWSNDHVVDLEVLQNRLRMLANINDTDIISASPSELIDGLERVKSYLKNE